MRTVRDDDDDHHYLLVKQSEQSSLVRDPRTGEEQHIPNERLEHVEGESPLATAVTAVPEELRRLVTAVPNERALGLLLELDRRGPIAVRPLMAAYDLCESDLHGLVAEFRAAGLVTEVRVNGQRGYDTTEQASEALATLRRD